MREEERDPDWYKKIVAEIENTIFGSEHSMHMSGDNGYVSNYLIHWAGKDKSPEERVSVLSRIATTCRLRLSKNELFFDGSFGIDEKMVCFTDVPLAHSEQHCAKYSRFGIAFHKLQLMGKGAQPVFYFTHIYKQDIGKIYRFVLDEINEQTLDPRIVEALHRHFYFMKEFAQERADRHDTAYYEREWRIGEPCLRPKEQDEGRWYLEHDWHPPTLGTLVTEGDEKYFEFEQADVAFLVAPNEFIAQISNPHQFIIESYENLVKQL